MSGSSPNMTVDNIFLSYSPNPIPTNFQLRSAFSSSTLPLPFLYPSFPSHTRSTLHLPPPPDKPSLKLLDKISRNTQFYPNQPSTTGWNSLCLRLSPEPKVSTDTIQVLFTVLLTCPLQSLIISHNLPFPKIH